MEFQGYSMFDEDPDLYKCAFADALQQLSESQLRKLAGNSMHMRAIGTCLLFALVGLHRVVE